MVSRSGQGDTRGETRSATYLLVIGDRAALAWVLKHERMAFPDFSRAETRALQVRDRLLIYTTRGCFRNPSRDYGRVMGDAVVASTVTALDRPLVISGRTFPVGCKLSLKRLAALHDGVVLRDLVPDLDAFPSKDSWPIRLRRPLVRLSEHDSDLLSTRLTPLVSNPNDNMEQYLQWLE
jgi:hypothetical protein